MFLIRKPSDAAIRAFIDEQSQLAFTYPAVDRNKPVIPRRYRPDHFRAQLGSGEAAFARAKAAVCCWKQFDVGWACARPGDTPIAPGQTVAVVFRTFGLWCVCSARIVYVIDEPNRFGFAYGTLPGHVESGEEQFLIEREGDGTVWYDVRAFSRPRHVLTKLGYPLVRRLQKQFVRQSAEVMRRAVEQG